jgi:2-oxo-4-hydroxy-4-carboxy-5-ureidoimidazoline decarboxylase
MCAARPFDDLDHLLATASEVWHRLRRADYLEAFAAHPKIGNMESLRSKFQATEGWSASEQAGIAGTSEEVLNRLAQENRRYEERFGHIFIVCASGKSAAEMLALLEERLSHHPEEELAIAAGEQEKITQLRLLKLIDSGEPAS